VAWPQASPAGEFRAAYRVVSADGHPIDGTITFTVEQALGPAAASPGAASAGPASVSASASAVSPTPEPAAGDADAGLLAWVLGVGVAVLAGAVAGTWFMRRTR
jgi:copper resistance protein C